MKTSIVGLFCMCILTTALATFDLCGIKEIGGGNVTLSLNFSAENANKSGDECYRAILFNSKRVKLTVEEAKFASGVVFEILDGPTLSRGVKLWSKPGSSELPSSLLSSSNAMFILFKDVSKGGNGPSTFRGRISSVPYKDKCYCRGVTNGKLECSESELQRRCEIKCKDSYMELSMNHDQSIMCDLEKGEWDIDIHSMPLSCQKIQAPLNIRATVNFNYVNLTCQHVDLQKVGSIFRAFIEKNATIGNIGMCFGSGSGDNGQCNQTRRLQVNCTAHNTSASIQVTIWDRIAEPANFTEANSKLPYLHKAYSNLNFKDVLDSEKLVLTNENSSSTILKESFVSMVMPWCGVESDYIKINGKEMFFVCSTCPMNHLYNSTAHVCQKCPPGTFAANRAKSCTQKNGTGLTPSKSPCDTKCTKGKRVDGDSGMCEWCPPNTYQNSSTKINPDCMPCPGEKKTLFPGALDVEECREPCSSGTFFNASGSICQNCPVGFYMDVDGHIIAQCKMCEIGKTTLATGSKTMNDCRDECMKGHFYNSSSKTCDLCPKGKYQDEMNKDTCKDCDHERGTLEYGSTSTSDCVLVCGLGQYLNDTYETCLQCPINTYQDNAEHRSKECKACGLNEITNATGTSNISHCISCHEGTFLNKSISQCKRCPKGAFQDQPGQDQCKRCPSGMTTDSDGQSTVSACVSYCGKGQYFDPSDKSCKLCMYGTFQESGSHRSLTCQKCPSKKTTVKKGTVDSKQCVTTDERNEFEAIKMSLKFTSLSWNDELYDTNSAMYQQTKLLIEEAIRFELRKDPSFEDVNVTDMRNGSVIADFELYFNDKVHYVPAKALQTAALSGKVGNFSVSPNSLIILRQDCAQPLGMENGNVKNNQITASTYLKPHEPYEGRLNANGGRGWEAEYTRTVEYLQIDFERQVNITGVATQGQSTSKMYVKEYKLSTSQDGKIWIDYTENGIPKILSGNQDSTTIARNNLATTITSRYIRFLPKTWNVRIFMRVEVYGCLPNALIPTNQATEAATGDATGERSPPSVAAIKAEEDKWPWGAYLGIVFAALLIIGIVIAIIFWKKKSKEKRDRARADEFLMGMRECGDPQYKVIEKNAAEPDGDDDGENLV